MDPFAPRRRRLAPADAETLAIAALSFLAAEPERLAQFAGATGHTLARSARGEFAAFPGLRLTFS